MRLYGILWPRGSTEEIKMKHVQNVITTIELSYYKYEASEI